MAETSRAGPIPASSFRSYSSGSDGVRGSLVELRDLIRHHRRDVPGRVQLEIALLQGVEQAVQARLGLMLEGRRMLDLGAGQGLRQMAYFAARGNRVVGVDRDLIVQGFDPWGYVRMARSNGVKRAVKTIARKALGIDARYRREFAYQLGTDRGLGGLTVHQMDAAAMALPDASFDFVYSFRVFQHLQEPAKVAREVARVVAPGGAVYLAFLPYTATNGCLDLRMLAGRGDELPLWAHLRPEYRGLVNESGYLNKLRLDDWQRLFEEAMPGSTLVVEQSESPELRSRAERLRAEGALLDYAPEELLVTNACLFWSRPA